VISNDLSSLFGPPAAGPALAAAYRQGTVISFNPVDGTNTVNVSGTVLTNLPMLLTGAETDYSVGDHVMLLVLGNTYMIVGKVAVPGSSSYASASQAFASSSNVVTNVGSSTTVSVVVSTSLTVPPWANQAMVWLIGTAQAVNTGGGTGAFYSQVQIDVLASTPLLVTLVPSGSATPLTSGDVQTMAVTPGGSITGYTYTAAVPAVTAVSTSSFTARMGAIFRKV
jgi:hypothetical protein